MQYTSEKDKNAISYITDFCGNILTGCFVGYSIDFYFSTKPIFLLVFIIIGFMSWFYQVVNFYFKKK